MDKYGNCTYALRYEYGFVTKDREPCLSQAMLKRAQEICESIAPGFEVQIESFTGSSRHIRLMVECSPATELTKFANSLKTVTSRRLRSEFGPAKLPATGLWANSYMVRTTASGKQAMDDYLG
jgi:putative transposase